MTQVLPAIIPQTKEQLTEEIQKVAKFAYVVQIDITDGVFVKTKTWPYNGKDKDFFEDLKTEKTGWPRWQDLEFEIHLMVKNPEEVLPDWIRTGAGTIVAHIEATENFQKVIDICRESHVSVGIAIKPSTDIAKIEDFIPNVDFIQVMGSDALGKHGVELDPKAVEMIKTLHRMYPERIIAIDIGVSEDTKNKLTSAGASKLISGGAILDAVNPEEVFENLSQ